MQRFVQMRGEEYVKLMEDIERFKMVEAEKLPKLLADLERFIETYEREVAPLSDSVKRFGVQNVALGDLLVRMWNDSSRHPARNWQSLGV